MERDDALRSACFLALDALQAVHGEDLPYTGALASRFVFGREHIPFLNYQKGIYRAAAQRGPAALSVNTSWQSPYDDEETSEGFVYAYRDGAIDQPDNRALRAAADLGVPLVYFVGMRPGWYRPIYPVFAVEDRPSERAVLLSPGVIDRFGPEPVPIAPEDPLVRRYQTRQTRVRLHQARFRGLVLPAYRDQCSICRLKEPRLLDAAHIVRDASAEGIAAVPNGLSLCSIHHRAFDRNLVGVSPEYRVHVSVRLLEDEDGPMLDLLKGSHGTSIVLPQRPVQRPSPDLLARRFDEFSAAAGG